jgi:Protein of unknown function (DUF4230)
MRKVLFGIVIALVLVFGLRYCEHEKDHEEELQLHLALIQKQLNKVDKLIVTEGTYAQVYTYEYLKTLYIDLFSAKKRALVVVNAKATIAYDLSKVETQIDAATKTVTITSIPEPELSTHPDIEYYGLQQDYLNQFEAADYDKIKPHVEDSLQKTIAASTLVSNAENRLISELQKIYLLTNSMGWMLKFKESSITSETDLQDLKF